MKNRIVKLLTVLMMSTCIVMSPIATVTAAASDTQTTAEAGNSLSTDLSGMTSSEQEKITYSALDFGDSGIQTTVPFSLKGNSIRRFEILYETTNYSNASPIVNFTANGKTYSATYGHAQAKDSPVTVKMGRDISLSGADPSKRALKEMVVYIDETKVHYVGDAELSITRNGTSALILAATKVPDDWKNTASGDESHLYPAGGSFQYFIDHQASFYEINDLAQIESEGLKGSSSGLATVSAPVKKPVDMTNTIIGFIVLGAIAAGGLIGFSIYTNSRKEKAAKKIKHEKKLARREAEVEKIKNSENIAEVLDELDYSDDYDDADAVQAEAEDAIPAGDVAGTEKIPTDDDIVKESTETPVEDDIILDDDIAAEAASKAVSVTGPVEAEAISAVTDDDLSLTDYDKLKLGDMIDEAIIDEAWDNDTKPENISAVKETVETARHENVDFEQTDTAETADDSMVKATVSHRTGKISADRLPNAEMLSKTVVKTEPESTQTVPQEMIEDAGTEKTENTVPFEEKKKSRGSRSSKRRFATPAFLAQS